jgi:hypothetical protein
VGCFIVFCEIYVILNRIKKISTIKPVTRNSKN